MRAQTLYQRALTYAAIAHDGQFRGDGKTPYIEHPLAVVANLIAAGCQDEQVLAAAALHDTIEDCGVTRDQLALLFGPGVADMVQEVTSADGMTAANKQDLQLEAFSRFSVGAQQIKLADKLCNVLDAIKAPPPSWSMQKVKRYLRTAELMARAPRWPSSVAETLAGWLSVKAIECG